MTEKVSKHKKALAIVSECIKDSERINDFSADRFSDEIQNIEQDSHEWNVAHRILWHIEHGKFDL